MATIFIRMDTLLLQARSSEKQRLPGFNRMVNLLKELSKSDRLYHKALSWAYLGIILERQSSFETTPMAIHDCGFTGTEPLDCFTKAIQLADNEPAVLNRLAKLFQIMGKHEMAIGTASMSLDVDPDHVTNVASYHTRARVHTSLYMRDLTRCKQGSSTMPERSLLEKAKDDLDQVIKSTPSLRAYMDLGQVCYYMGVDAIKESFAVNEEWINQALIYFSKALECDLGSILPELQLLRGKCLKVKGEESNAVECFKRSIEMERDGSRNSQAFRYCQGGPMKRGAILNEVDTWVSLVLNKFDNRSITSEIRTVSHIYTHELLDLCKGTIKEGKISLSRLCFSMFPTTVTDNQSYTESTD
uniref:tetratricopeptide repeat protein 22-like isoform X2 n=1 Tax=Ciona intestinalis TaxID=7719 RepID=UPI000EF4B7E4|nr:tetratricopeptide repeat protein 22-like isoform X2 [Ciona intestinalis]|eukprot:XP_026695452.1 tetratricopeptide repeat protein 22-like isoform X2 [Ciona intestinalis]